MEKKRIMKRNGLLVAMGFAIMIFMFTSCKKSGNDINYNPPSASLMAFNLVPDKGCIGITIGSSRLNNTPLSYTSYTGFYQAIFPGTREVAAFDFNSNTPFAATTAVFDTSHYYSVFTLGVSGNYKNLVVRDELDSLSAATGQAYVRYINAIPDSSKLLVTLTAAGTDLSNSSTGFATISGFSGVNPGELTIKVANGTNISATRTIKVEKVKIYTILLIGLPGATDTEKQVQIKFITNGTIS